LIGFAGELLTLRGGLGVVVLLGVVVVLLAGSLGGPRRLPGAGEVLTPGTTSDT
jgi:hypothetical protein